MKELYHCTRGSIHDVKLIKERMQTLSTELQFCLHSLMVVIKVIVAKASKSSETEQLTPKQS